MPTCVLSVMRHVALSITLVLAAALTAAAQNAESVDPQAITMTWGTPLDGSSSVDTLAFAALNTTAQPLNVELKVTAGDGLQQTTSAPYSIQIPAYTSSSFTVRVAELGLADWPISTRVSARYVGADGLSHQTGLETVWLRSTSDFQHATVRSAANESRMNAISGFRRDAGSVMKAVPSAEPSVRTAGVSVGRTLLVQQSGLLPYPNLAPKIGQAAVTRSSALAAPYILCFTMPYVYFDQGLGEDMLTQGSDVLDGQSPASFMHFVLTDVANTAPIVDVFLDANGCTGPVQLENGQFTTWLTTQLSDGATTINIRSTQGAEFVWYSRLLDVIGGDSATIAMSGTTAASNVGVAAAVAMQRLGGAFSGLTIEVFTDVNCPQFPFSACADNGLTFFGSNGDGVPITFYKNIVLHELGHHVQAKWFGNISNDGYKIDPGVPELCLCTQVTNTTASHCLQSRHKNTAGQVEGFGHFFASDVLNRSEDNDCTFGYYKAFREASGQISQPPTARSCMTPVRWMETHCNENSVDRSTEYDWLGFYWNVKNKTADAFSYADMGAVYAQACGGRPCAGQSVAWNSLQNGANTLYGNSGPKAVYWALMGTTYGVQH